MTEIPVHLLDVNLAVAVLDQDHVHNQAADQWLNTPGLRWASCAFTDAGVLRYFTRPKSAQMTIGQTSAMLNSFKQHPGYHFQPITADWQALTAPFAKRIHGHNQVTDAYLLGLAVREGMILTTFDKALLHLAGEHKRHVLVLETN